MKALQTSTMWDPPEVPTKVVILSDPVLLCKCHIMILHYQNMEIISHVDAHIMRLEFRISHRQEAGTLRGVTF